MLALYQLGQIYEIGVNGHIEKDIDKAMEYYKEATEIDFPFAFNKLAYLSYCTRKYQQFLNMQANRQKLTDLIHYLLLKGR
ncbi:SEL1-like repeat protein [Neisseria subflava]|uniref:SEL1-like repeat protein n=1 Tax=Neisseria subflava TaxID=28449 RepID=UPI0023584582|nr:SEL1-like repeat protein [Neisseria sp. KH1003-01]